MVFQNPASQMLSSSTEEEIIFGLENLGLARHAIHERLEDTLARFDLEALRDRSPQTLSGGEQQKLALAAIMARRPPLLVLDEPLSMLDGAAVIDLVDHLAELADTGTSVVICEHRAELVQSLPELETIPLNNHRPLESPSPNAFFPSMAHTPAFALDIRDLSIALGEGVILHNLSLWAEGGCVVAIVGRNGVGKTTLLRALAGLQQHTGTITIDGKQPDLGMVFQNPDLQLFNPTVREEILYRVPEPDMALYNWIVQTLGLESCENSPPLLLSEGEKKRVALATVLMHHPRHGILLDEPSLGQDSLHKRMLIRLCCALAEAGKLVILTTHDLGLAAQADRLLLLGPDGFVADGPPADVVRNGAAWSSIGLPIPSPEVVA